MTDLETVKRLCTHGQLAPEHCRFCPSDLDRATQALKDAATVWSVACADTAPTAVAKRLVALHGLQRAAEDYADAYLRGTK